MTASEALQEIQHQIHRKTDNCDMTISKDCYKTVVSALEKQIPKKATEKTTNRGIDISGEYDIDFDLCCPICGAVVGTFEEGVNEYFSKHCDNCGQALDRSDRE